MSYHRWRLAPIAVRLLWRDETPTSFLSTALPNHVVLSDLSPFPGPDGTHQPG